jgi:putative oxidoreductase
MFAMIKRLLQTTNHPVLTIVRLILGVLFFARGAQKALGWFDGYGFAGTLEGFSNVLYAFVVQLVQRRPVT